MAIFPSATVGSIEKNDDIAKVNQYLRKLNDDLVYMFNNLTPEDNYSASAPKLIYSVDENGEASFEISSSGIKMRVASDEYVKSNVEILDNKISLKVSAGDVTKTLNSELVLDENKIELSTTGKLYIESGNLTIDEDGNATFSGELSAASGTFAGQVRGGSIAIGGTSAAVAPFQVDSNGNLIAASGTFSGVLSGATIDGSKGIDAGSAFWVTYYSDSARYYDYEVATGQFRFVYDTPYGHCFENSEASSPASSATKFLVQASDAVVFCSDVRPYTRGIRWQNGLAYYVDLLWDWYEEEHGGGGGGDDSESDIPIDSELDGPLDP